MQNDKNLHCFPSECSFKFGNSIDNTRWVFFLYQFYQARLWECLLTSRSHLLEMSPQHLGRDETQKCLVFSITIENTRWVSFDIKFTRQGFENAWLHHEACRDIENTRWVSFDIKFTRQGFEDACWHREAWEIYDISSLAERFNKHSQSLAWYTWYQKPQTWYSVYQFAHCLTLQTSDYDVIVDFCVV